MSKVAVIVKLTAQPGKRDELATAFKVMLDAVESESGTLTYILHSDNGEEDVLWFYELYADNDAFSAHGSSETMKSVGPSLAPLLAGRPELHIVTPIGGKGL
jgi:quinol monooxygenase YgiN